MKTGIFITFLVVSCSVLAQNPVNDPYNHRIIVREISTPVLKSMESNNPVKFEQIKYYYSQSFSAELIDCSSCPIDYFDLFNLNLFNVKDYEDQREELSSVSFEFNDKYTITLYSKKAVELAYSDIRTEIETALAASLNSSLPSYVITGDTISDYQNYKTALLQYQSDFPEDYQLLISRTGFLTISIEEFNPLPPNKKTAFINNAKGYVILDDYPVGGLTSQ